MAHSAAVLADLAAGIVSGGIRVVDLTVPLEPATPTIQLPPQFAPSKPFSLEEISKYDERDPQHSGAEVHRPGVRHRRHGSGARERGFPGDGRGGAGVGGAVRGDSARSV